MRLFKPYVNLTKSESTGIYTMNAVVALPKGYALSSLSQSEIKKNGKKLWAVTAKVITNGSESNAMAEFSVPLEQGPTKEVKSTSMVIVESSALRNPVEDNSTEVDYEDAESTLP
ncbi:hypothetical protein [Ancylomarina longa]|uniref:Uncharacterized protein n=1 Tax=Ancylomarina longa TaxID=2487017 RepID=A0A434AT94_9BACT|nr:hypothetical protein [Ancylomarina longa]RUT77635.1 hypothetical protein DLK05_11935 [Ancylomarina longa]